MTPEQITLVQSSFERLGPDLPAMTVLFYQELFRRDPSLRPLFTTEMGELITHTRALGARHAGYGVRAADYQTVGDSLIAALAGTLGEEFDAATREAWELAFNIVAETMLEGAAAARPIGS